LKRQPNLLHFGDEFTDFSETATLISQPHPLILVVTVVAHRTGALAKPIHVFLARVFDRRWQLTGDNGGWCSPAGLPRQDASAALGERFRQKAIGRKLLGERSWEPGIARVRLALCEHAPRTEIDHR